MYKDPVCGMDVEPETAAGKSEYKGQTYYFCSLGCKASFGVSSSEPENLLMMSFVFVMGSQVLLRIFIKRSLTS